MIKRESKIERQIKKMGCMESLSITRSQGWVEHGEEGHWGRKEGRGYKGTIAFLTSWANTGSADRRKGLNWARRNKRETQLTSFNDINLWQFPKRNEWSFWATVTDPQNNRHLNLRLDSPSYWHKPKSLHYNLNSTNEYCKDDRRGHREWSQRH